ncbi:MAG: GTP-binding protein [Candidatus Hermodarchaeota archaeon]
MAEEYDYLFKSIVVGDGGVGKTALTLRFSKGFFTEDYKMTIGVDFHVKTIAIDSVEGPIRAKLQIWDTGGQERFSSIRPMYYRGSLGALLIFDLTNSASFEHLPQWIEEVRANVKTEIPLLLVGNKSDLVEQRAVSLEEINTFTNNFNLYYMETSAKTGEGVGDCFYILACLMIGSGVPDQLISRSIVFSPGQVPTTAVGAHPTPMQQLEPEFDYAAPPVPEPVSPQVNEPIPSFEPEPEYEFEAPPVPEPVIEPEFEPEIPLPESQVTERPSQPVEFEFKTPDEILFTAVPETPSQSIDIISGEESYKPKAVPFTDKVPVPAPAPEGFQSQSGTSSAESTPSSTSAFFPVQHTAASKSDSLMDYLPEPVYSKKDKKKIEKQKKKEEKEKKLREEQERQERLLEEMKSTKKEKKQKPKKEKKEKVETVPEKPASTPEVSTTTSLFQTLSQKTEPEKTPVTAAFMPFTAKTEPESQETSKLRIIPNVSNIETFPPQEQPVQAQQAKPAGKEIIICKQCGATLSSDYQFCNKCGSQL